MWNRETPVSLIGPGGGVSLRTKMRPFRALVLMPEVGCCLLKLHSIHECIWCPKVPFLRNIASDIFSTLGMTHTMKGEGWCIHGESEEQKHPYGPEIGPAFSLFFKISLCFFLLKTWRLAHVYNHFGALWYCTSTGIYQKSLLYCSGS